MRIWLILIAALPAAPALAADPPRPPVADERRLSDTEIEDILEAAAVKREQATAPAAQPARPIEGEVGLSFDSGGAHSVFGTAIVPVGTEGVAIISIDGTESRRDYRRRR